MGILLFFIEVIIIIAVGVGMFIATKHNKDNESETVLDKASVFE